MTAVSKRPFADSPLGRLLRRHDGPLTGELRRRPGGFGLGQVPERLAPDKTTSMICGFCATGCSLDVHLRGDEAINLTPSVDYPVNQGMACPKGWEALTPLASDDRLTTPMYRPTKGAPLEPISWERALEIFCDRMRAVAPVERAFLSTGQIPTEEMALLGALARFGLGIRHCDGNTRQCMATAATAYKQSFGFDAPPYTYADFEESDVIVLVGSNLSIAHPILWERVARNRHDAEVVVIDPRRTETAVAASRHLAIAPKSDLALFYGVASLLIERDAVDRAFVDAHTTGYDEFAAHVAAFDLERVCATTGLDPAEIVGLVDLIEAGERVSFWWTMGVNQSHEGTRTAQAIIDLALLTGNIGRPGTGANSITGQCNAMGSRLFSFTTGLPGGLPYGDADHRARVAEVFGVDGDLVPSEGGWAYDQIMSGIDTGDIKALWVIATNTAHSWIDQRRAVDRLDDLEFLVVQDLYGDTATAARADLVLPAAGWGEKSGTFINSERRIGVIKQVRRAPGQALADFWIFKAIAEAWGCGEMFDAWSDPETTFSMLARISAGTPCDFSGLSSYDEIDRARGVQWPAPVGADELDPERRLFADGRFFTPDERARFVIDRITPTPETTDDRFPFVLLSGRGTSTEWHTGTRTDRSPVLRAMSPDRLHVEVAPADAARLGIGHGDRVTVTTAQGSLEATARVTPTIQPGHLFLPMHHLDTNRVTAANFDPHSRQPSFKHAAATVAPIAADSQAATRPVREITGADPAVALGDHEPSLPANGSENRVFQDGRNP